MGKTITISEENARKAFNEGTPEIRKMLSTLCAPHIFKTEPKRNYIDTFELVCEDAGEDIDDYEINDSMTYKEKWTKDLDALILLEKVFNVRPINRADTSESKWSAWHNVDKDKDAPAGFRLSFDVCGCGASRAVVGARPEFLEKADAEYVGTKFMWLHELIELVREPFKRLLREL